MKFREVKCTLTTLRVFDTLKESNKIVRSNGSIVKCLPMYVNGENSKGGIGGNAFELEVADNLRKVNHPFYSISDTISFPIV